MLPWQHVTLLVSISNYTFIVCIVLRGTCLPIIMYCLRLFTCKPCCVTTCGYGYQHTLKFSTFDVTYFLRVMGV